MTEAAALAMESYDVIANQPVVIDNVSSSLTGILRLDAMRMGGGGEIQSRFPRVVAVSSLYNAAGGLFCSQVLPAIHSILSPLFLCLLMQGLSLLHLDGPSCVFIG